MLWAVILYVNCRKKSSHSDKFAVSVNRAYGQMSLKLSGRTEGEYENPDRLTDTSTSTAATYETIDTWMGPEYVYARADEVVRTTNEQ